MWKAKLSMSKKRKKDLSSYDINIQPATHTQIALVIYDYAMQVTQLQFDKIL